MTLSFIFLLIFFFVWSYILELIALLLVNNKPKFFFYNHSIFSILLLLTSTISLYSAYKANIPNFPILFFYLSALWITIHTDIRYMLISRLVSLYLVPIGIIASIYEYLPIHPIESILVSFSASLFFIIINKIFYFLKGHDGLGQGDIELIACIGAWTGFFGTWFTITCSSISGTIIGYFYIFFINPKIRIFPFGPFLAFSNIIYIIHQQKIIQTVFNTLLQ